MRDNEGDVGDFERDGDERRGRMSLIEFGGCCVLGGW